MADKEEIGLCPEAAGVRKWGLEQTFQDRYSFLIMITFHSSFLFTKIEAIE